MIAYNYSRETGEYTGFETCQESPLEPGAFLVPANATNTPPPKVELGHVAVFESGVWVEKVDLRGTLYYDPDGTEHRIQAIGETVPDTCMLERPEPTPTPEPDTTNFDSACAQFRSVCSQIESYFQLPGFTGGFDEMAQIQGHPSFLTLQGQALTQAWNAANKLCTYEGAKLGYSQPQWWYQCWNIEP